MKRKVLFALLAALLIVGVVALAACAPTQEDADAFYADLRAQAEEANADLGAVMAETAKSMIARRTMGFMPRVFLVSVITQRPPSLFSWPPWRRPFWP